MLGIAINQEHPVKDRFLGILDETDAKIQKFSQVLKLNSESLSLPEIQCYERCISNLVLLLLSESSDVSLFLLKSILKEIKIFVHSNKAESYPKDQHKTDIIYHICKNLRNELILNKRYFILRNEYWIILYKIMRYEAILKPKC